jgi:hypothetical protein
MPYSSKEIGFIDRWRFSSFDRDQGEAASWVIDSEIKMDALFDQFS